MHSNQHTYAYHFLHTEALCIHRITTPNILYYNFWTLRLGLQVIKEVVFPLEV